MTTSLQPGEIIRGAQDYEILGHLGAGGMGSIYRARDTARGDLVAIKMVIPPDSDAADSLLDRLLTREATTLRQIDHRAVVRYRDFVVRGDGAKLLVMELVPGPTLREHIRRGGPLSWEAWLLLRDRLASGLAAVHDCGIIHRDLSPDNIVLRDGRPDRPVLIDFGVARDRHATGGTIIGDRQVGKYLYASPEQLLDPSAVSPASDLYSFGLVMAFAARGTALPMGESERQAIERRRALPDLEGLDERIRWQLSLLLRPRIAERPGSIAAFLDLAEVDPPTDEQPAPSGDRPAPPAAEAPVVVPSAPPVPATRWRFPAILTGSLVVAGITVIVLLFLPSIREDLRQREWAALDASRDVEKIADFARRHEGTREASLALRRMAVLRDGRAEDALSLTKEERQRVQAALYALGYEIGPRDGNLSAATRAAIAGWQSGKGLEATGFLTRPVMDRLLADAAANPQRPPELPAGRAIADFRVYFDHASTTLRPEAQIVIREVADRYRGAGGIPTKITLTGYGDATLQASEAAALAYRMANAVRDALIRAGVPAAAIVATWRNGGDAPDEVTAALNRRVDVALLQ